MLILQACQGSRVFRMWPLQDTSHVSSNSLWMLSKNKTRIVPAHPNSWRGLNILLFETAPYEPYRATGGIRKTCFLLTKGCGTFILTWSQDIHFESQMLATLYIMIYLSGCDKNWIIHKEEDKCKIQLGQASLQYIVDCIFTKLLGAPAQRARHPDWFATVQYCIT